MALVTDKIAEAPEVRPVHEPDISVEPGSNVQIETVEFQVAGTSLQIDLVSRPGFMAAIIEFGFAGHRLRVHLPVLIDLDVGIESGHTIEPHHARRGRAE